MIIDIHGHYTTAPKALEDGRNAQIAGIADTIRMPRAADLKISLDLDDGVAFNYWLMSAAGQEYLTGRTLKGLQDLVYAGTDLKMADLEKKSQWKRDLLAQAQGEQASG